MNEVSDISGSEELSEGTEELFFSKITDLRGCTDLYRFTLQRTVQDGPGYISINCGTRLDIPLSFVPKFSEIFPEILWTLYPALSAEAQDLIFKALPQLNNPSPEDALWYHQNIADSSCPDRLLLSEEVPLEPLQVHKNWIPEENQPKNVFHFDPKYVELLSLFDEGSFKWNRNWPISVDQAITDTIRIKASLRLIYTRLLFLYAFWGCSTKTEEKGPDGPRELNFEGSSESYRGNHRKVWKDRAAARGPPKTSPPIKLAAFQVP